MAIRQSGWVAKCSRTASPDLHPADLAGTRIHDLHLKLALDYIQADNLLAVEGADDLPGAHCCNDVLIAFPMVFLRTAFYHVVGAFIP